MKYTVTWKMEFSRVIEAKDTKEALEIAEDLGDVDADCRMIADKKAKKIKQEEK